MRPHRHFWHWESEYESHVIACVDCGWYAWGGQPDEHCEICGELDCEEHAVCPVCGEHTSSENPCDCEWQK